MTLTDDAKSLTDYKYSEIPQENARPVSAEAGSAMHSAQDFCEWLRRFFSGIQGRDELTALEANTIRNTLNAMDARHIDDTKDKFKLHYPKYPSR